MGKRSKRKAAKIKLAKKAGFNHHLKIHRIPNSYKDNFGNNISPIELVFPIVRKINDNEFEAVGTGFFIHPAGGFVTAKHCLYDNDQYDEACYVIQSLSRNEHILRKIQYFEPHPIADIGVGMLRGQVQYSHTRKVVLKPSFPLAKEGLDIEQEIMTLAYPRMKIAKGQYGKFPCDKYNGKIIDHRPNGTGILKSECFITNMEIKSGASGGPVLRRNLIVGVNSSGFDTPAPEEPISFITPIKFIYDLQLKDSDGKLTTIQDLMENGYMVTAQ